MHMSKPVFEAPRKSKYLNHGMNLLWKQIPEVPDYPPRRLARRILPAFAYSGDSYDLPVPLV